VTASNLSTVDRDLEALRRAQQAHESSMDEILASLRDIIADDNNAPPEVARAPKGEVASGPQIVYRNEAMSPAAAPMPKASPEPRSGAIASTPRNVWETARRATESSPDPATESEADTIVDPPLASAATDAVVAASFNALSASIALQNSGMIESLMREMLRPMLKSWINDNLPGLVERLVRAEIQRVARGRR
jgi:cell pole-organizing protein PopZ